jgi:amino acid transporter
VAGNALIISQQVSALIAFVNGNFEIPSGFNWLTVVFMIVAMIISTSVNVYGVRLLPWLEGLMFMIHIAGFFAILFPLWIMGERTPTEEVFFTFQDNSGWGSIGLACLVGILGPTVTLVGGDSAAHLGEEVKDASKALPQSMISTALVNYIIGFIMTITILSVAGNFDEDLANNLGGQSWIAVIYAATRSRTATIIFTVLVILLFCFCATNSITTTSRQLWAFSRDGGLPYSSWLSRVNPTTGVPVNSLIATFAITFLLSFIAAASTIAFNNIISISLVGLLLSYGSTIFTMMLRRARREPLPPSYLQYSKPVGFLINGFALCFVTVAFVFVFFPTAPDPSLESMNWSALISGGVILFAAAWYAVGGKKQYFGPAERIRRMEGEEGGSREVSFALSVEVPRKA